MATATYVKKARKDDSNYNIKRGDSYWWWQFPFLPRMKSKKKPDRAQLTQSMFMKSVYKLEDREITSESDVIKIVRDIQNLKADLKSKLNNMPESLRRGTIGILIQERYERLEDWEVALKYIEWDNEYTALIEVNKIKY